MVPRPSLMKARLLVVSAALSGISTAQTTLTYQDGLGGYSGTRDTGVRSTIPTTDAGQLTFVGWDDNVIVDVFTFENGTDGYSGTSDTVIAQSASTTDAGSWTYWGWDTDALGQPFPAYALVKFDSVFGVGLGQVNPGAQVSSALLEYSCFNTGGPANVHEMNSVWTESTTWSSFSHNYSAFPTSSASGGSLGQCDLTQSLQSMSNGAQNHGWVFIPTSSSGVEAHSSEATTGARPRLTVTTTETDTAYTLIRFDGLVGNASGQIPPGSTVQSAHLVYEVYNSGDSAELHHMISSWSESETWNSFQSLSYDPQVIATGFGGMGQQSVDVTNTIQAYADGAVNRGWVFISTANDGVEAHSSEAPTQALRPKLVVTLPSSGSNSGVSSCDCSAGNSPCGNSSGPGRGCPNSNGNGLGAKLIAAGHASITADTFSLSVTDAAPNKPGLIFAGTSNLGPSGVNTVPNNAGLLCVAGTTARGSVVFTDSSGAATFGDFQGAPYGASSLVAPGWPTSYTHWFRDPGTATGCANDTGNADFNFSNGWTVTWQP